MSKQTNEKDIYHIYDSMFKRIFNLSNLAIINLINGLFGTNYPPDSSVEHPNKEFISTTLGKRLADEIVIIQGTPYHLEAQMKKDGAIIMRVFEYGFHYAMSVREDDNVLRFPEPIIIYLNNEVNIPEKSVIQIDFGNQGTFSYEVQNFIYQAHDICELNQRKLIILIPFHLLKFKKLIAQNPSKENFKLLQTAIFDDIIESIKANQQVGNITNDDAIQLQELTRDLFDYVYKNYDDLGGYSEVKPLLEGAWELPGDKYRIRIDELEKENEKKEATLQEKEAALQEKDTLIAQLQEELANKK